MRFSGFGGMRVETCSWYPALALAFGIGVSTAACGSADDDARNAGGDPQQVDGPAAGSPGGSGVDAGPVSPQPDAGPAPQDAATVTSTDAAPPVDAGQREFIDPEDLMDAGTDAGIDAAVPDPVYFRITQLWLRDPRFFLGTSDITDTPFLGQSVNGTLIPNGLTMDYDGDTYADVSFVLAFASVDPTAASSDLQLMDAHCVVPQLAGCIEHPSPGLFANFTAMNQAADSCLEPVAGSATSFTAASGEIPMGPCFVTQEERDVVLDLNGIRLELTATRVAASYSGAGPDQLVQGLIRGFLTESFAQTVQLPSYLPVLGNTPLTDYLRVEEKDLAQSPTGADGWWVYLNFVAEPVRYYTQEEL